MFNRIKNYCKKIFYSKWFPLYLLLCIPIIHFIFGIMVGKDVITYEGTTKEQGWFFIANAFEYLGVNIALVYLLNNRHTRVKMLYIMLASFIMFFLEIFDVFGEWLFYNSMWKTALINFQPKDGDAIFMIVYVSLLILYIFKLIYETLKKNIYVNTVLITMNLFAIVSLTTLFHLYAVQFNYANSRLHSWQQMEKATSLNKQDFYVMCKYKNWECAYYDENPMVKIFDNLPPIFKSTYSEIFQTTQNQPIVKTSQTIYDPLIDTRHRFINFKKNNIWIIDKKEAFVAFDRAENIFLSLCAVAHFFWMYLTMFLIILHKDKQIIWSASGNKSKWINSQ